jgi:hypothetical protein
MGWFLGTCMDFLVRIIDLFCRVVIRAIKFRGSHNWIARRGTVTDTGVDRPGLGCATGWVTYIFRIDDEPFTGLTRKPFISADSAEEYTSRFGRDSMVVLRVKPGEPEISAIRDDDQVGPVAKSLREASEHLHT